MTRQKKSRKPGTLGAKSQPKEAREHKKAGAAAKAPRNKGKPAGNRHSIEPVKAASAGATEAQKDPRVGSKRKISLEVEHPKPAKVKAEPVTAKVAVASAGLKPALSEGVTQAEDEFARLENDPRLQDLLAQMDAGETISAADNTWVEAQLNRYRELATELGIDLDDMDDDIEDDDDLEPWKKFDNPKDWV